MSSSIFCTLARVSLRSLALGACASLFCASVLAAESVQIVSPVAVSAFAKSAHANPLLAKGFKTEGVAISFNADALHQLNLGDEALVALPNGTQYAVVYDNEVDYRDGTRSWVGYLRDHGKQFRIVATTGAGGTYGFIQTPDDDWSIVPGPDGAGFNLLVNAAREMEKNPIPGDPADFRISSKSGADLNQNPVFDAKSTAALSWSRAGVLPYERSLGKAAPSPQATIDIAIVVTQGFATFHGTNMTTRVNQLVTAANTAYATSEVAITLNRVGAILVRDYPDTSPAKDIALSDITNNTGVFADLESHRASVGADLVGLLRNVNDGGIAWIGTVSGSPPTESLANPRNMYSVTGVCNFAGCDSVFIHELGHNMGLNHDRANAGTPLASTRPYAFGWKIDAGNTNRDFRTIMSYAPPSNRVLVFSNPNLFICNPSGWSPPDACGVASSSAEPADNARALNDNRFLVANAKTANGVPVPPKLVLVAPTQRFVAAAGNASFAVQRLGDPASAVSVNFATANGTALAGVDYTAASGTLSWAAGDATAKSINVPTLNGGAFDDKTFTVALSGAAGPAGTSIATPSSFVVTLAPAGAWPLNNVLPAGWVQTAGANAGWAVVSGQASEGMFSLASLPILDSQVARIEFTSTTPSGNLFFRRKVSSEATFDYFRVYLNGVEVASASASGEVDWTLVTVPIPAGTNTVRFSYEKDNGVATGDDKAYIDALRFVSSPSDLSADNKSDILYTDGNTALNALLMNGTAITSGASILPSGSGWTVTHVADFNGDGKADILMRAADGRVAILTMNGASAVSYNLIFNAGSGYSATHVADLNGDGKADIIAKNTDGSTVLLLMNGGAVTSAAFLQNPGSPWTVTHTGDFNGDGKVDVLIRHTDGSAVILLMDGTLATSAGNLLSPGAPWTVTHVADLNGDGKADIIIRANDGTTALLRMNGTVVQQSALLLAAGGPWSVTHTGDFNGDGNADILIRNTDGSVVMLQMQGTSVIAATYLLLAGNTMTVARVADYNGDGKADILLRTNNGGATLLVMNGGVVSASANLWGAGTATSVP